MTIKEAGLHIWRLLEKRMHAKKTPGKIQPQLITLALSTLRKKTEELILGKLTAQVQSMAFHQSKIHQKIDRGRKKVVVQRARPFNQNRSV
mmetsp:Transcript_33831/g.38462  ORF Transcript_33831/g.38462 Transcript_33831/m.38462 type:complete len:91 (-) Transcript_33831:95-367(-)